ncbi:hypothetical protein GRF29_28g2387235 [Pseudopithomyces chartarum]|uniref:Zinc/iron permease n=1 Tax=Pseudopithomyces chartarum TaxID=1892770 RepID=A0AAN6RI75_9PLEO|nr:hypothetical protein GRF29_28g2387235 [Pseudopithomyces chartarum]
MSTCGSDAPEIDYNLSLHVGALFIILGVSAGACAVPVLALSVPQLRIPAKVHFGFRHFGTGVLLATAFVHLLPTAFVSLVDPCLPSFFNKDYPALAGAIALSAVFMITIAEMVFSPGRSLCSGSVAPSAEAGIAHAANHRNAPNPTRSSINDITPAQSTPQFGRTRSGRSHSTMKAVDQQNRLPQDNDLSISEIPQNTPTDQSTAALRDSEDGDTVFEEKEAEHQRSKLLMQCVLLECGILFHSIFIGMALAVAVGSAQVILIIAIAFHQTFEGLALGSRIAAVGWEPKAFQPWIMALAYGCTTPLGQAIGIATRNLYDPNSATGLVVVGTFNAFSAGLLAYTSLVDLLSEDFLSDHSWKTLRGKRRVVAMVLVFSGAFCMSLIGAWA